MITRLIFPGALLLAVLFSCADNDLPNEPPILEQELTAEATEDVINPDSTFLSCDSVFIATYPGTACCVSGPIVAKPGDIFQYHYQMNHLDAQVFWRILEGDISIIAGQNTHTVTVEFGPGYTAGIVQADGKGLHRDLSIRQFCQDRIIIAGD